MSGGLREWWRRLHTPVAQELRPPPVPQTPGSMAEQAVVRWILADILSGGKAPFVDRAAFVVLPFAADYAAAAGAAAGAAAAALASPETSDTSDTSDRTEEDR